jgi:hypothetical protein
MDNYGEFSFESANAIINTWVFTVKQPCIMLYPYTPAHQNKNLHCERQFDVSLYVPRGSLWFQQPGGHYDTNHVPAVLCKWQLIK